MDREVTHQECALGDGSRSSFRLRRNCQLEHRPELPSESNINDLEETMVCAELGFQLLQCKLQSLPVRIVLAKSFRGPEKHCGSRVKAKLLVVHPSESVEELVELLRFRLEIHLLRDENGAAVAANDAGLGLVDIGHEDVSAMPPGSESP